MTIKEKKMIAPLVYHELEYVNERLEKHLNGEEELQDYQKELEYYNDLMQFYNKITWRTGIND